MQSLTSKLWKLALAARAAIHPHSTIDELVWADDATLAHMKLPFALTNEARRERRLAQALRTGDA